MSVFKICPKCKHAWETREDFLGDSSIAVIGFLADNEEVEKGAYLFNHLPPGNECNSTLGVYVSNFLDLYDGPFYEELKTGSKECSGYCAKVEELERCNACCRNAVAREIISIIKDILSRNGAPK